MLLKKKNGFTLVELLVVMSIIGLLAAVLVTQVSKMTETARALKCKANLKNLGQAALNYGVDNGRMPWAGSHECTESRGTSGGSVARVDLRRGWVDWTTKAGEIETWPKDYSPGSASYSGNGRMVTYCEGKPGFISVTNGVLWQYMGRDISSYVCEAFRSKVNSVEPIYRSYFMNCYFGYNKNFMPLNALSDGHRQISPNSFHNFDYNFKRNLTADNNKSAASVDVTGERLLLFAELPVTQSGIDPVRAVDGVIETQIIDQNYNIANPMPLAEVIGFNHMVGKRYVAHVVFADGHVDVLYAPLKTSDAQYFKKWTGYLCNGLDVPKNSGQWTLPPKFIDLL